MTLISKAKDGKELEANLSRDDHVEAVPIDVLNGDNLEPRLSPQAHGSAVQGHVAYRELHIGNPAVRDNSRVQCCYPITVADPDEVVHARQVAIAQVSFESALLIFCRSGWCVWAWLFAMPSSIAIASCCKHRITYIIWGGVDIFVSWFHAVAAVAAVAALRREDDRSWDVDFSREFILTVQIILCGVGLFAAHINFKAVSALRNQVHSNAGAEVPVPTRAFAYPAVEEHYPQPSVSP